jgi:hypothetical protein
MLTTKPKGLTHGYDDDGQNVGDENVGVELDGVRHDARLYRRSVFIANQDADGTGTWLLSLF